KLFSKLFTKLYHNCKIHKVLCEIYTLYDSNKMCFQSTPITNNELIIRITAPLTYSTQEMENIFEQYLERLQESIKPIFNDDPVFTYFITFKDNIESIENPEYK